MIQNVKTKEEIKRVKKKCKATISGLESDCEYEICVYAINDKTKERTSMSESVRFHMISSDFSINRFHPSVPTDLKYEISSNNNNNSNTGVDIIVSWKSPMLCTGTISYDIFIDNELKETVKEIPLTLQNVDNNALLELQIQTVCTIKKKKGDDSTIKSIEKSEILKNRNWRCKFTFIKLEQKRNRRKRKRDV